MNEQRHSEPANEKNREAEYAELSGLVRKAENIEDQFFFGGVRISYSLAAEADENCNELHPGEMALTSDLHLDPAETGGTSVSVWIWEGTPVHYRPILLYHEAREGWLILKERISRHAAHVIARNEQMKLAGEVLSPAELQEFLKWDASRGHSTHTDNEDDI